MTIVNLLQSLILITYAVFCSVKYIANRQDATLRQTWAAIRAFDRHDRLLARCMLVWAVLDPASTVLFMGGDACLGVAVSAATLGMLLAVFAWCGLVDANAREAARLRARATIEQGLIEHAAPIR